MFLRKGSQNSSVKKLQEKLIELEYDVGAMDGVFGPRTEGAVLKYQKENGLSVDGIVGDETWNSLFGEDIPRLVSTLEEPPSYSRCFDVFGDFRVAGWEQQNLARCDLSEFRAELGHVYLGWMEPDDKAFTHITWFGFVCHRLLVPKFQAAFKNLVEGGLANEVKTFDGCLAVRYIRGGQMWSTHSWAISIDLNAPWNRFGQTDFEMSTDFAKCFQDVGFVWGADFTGRTDAMHLQYCAVR